MGRQDTRYQEGSMPSLLRVPTPQDFLCGLVSHLHLPPSPTSSSTWISHILPCVERISNQHLGVRRSTGPSLTKAAFLVSMRWSQASLLYHQETESRQQGAGSGPGLNPHPA